MATEEVWREVPGYPLYQVSDIGRVRSRLARGYSLPRDEWRLLKCGKSRYGYPRVCLLGPDGRHRFRQVHNLVLEAFVGPRPTPKQDGRHLDDDKGNNSLANLAWGTRADNLADSKRNGRECNGERSPGAKITAADVFAIRRRRTAGERCGDLAREFGLDSSTVSQICAGKRWRHLPSCEVVG